MKHIYNIGKATALALAALLSAACTNELAEQDPVTGLRPGDVALQWVPANMAVHTVTTRGTDPKTALEQQINNVHVFIFDNTGQYLGAQGNDAFQGYRYQEGNATMVLNRELFDNATQDASDATVVVLANMPKDTFHDTDGNGRPDEIENINSFADFVFNLPSFCATIPEGGLPMMVRKDDVDLSPNPEGTSGVRVETLQLRSLMARIDLDFTLEPAQESGSNLYPSLNFSQVTVGNFPSGGTITPQLAGTNVTETEDKGSIELITEEVTEGVDDFVNRPIREREPQSLTLYMFEHARAAKALGEVFDGRNDYPEGIDETEKQRYKNWLAQKDAAYVELKGVYTNHNNYQYHVTYTLYPGANATDDFIVKTNCQYKNNITVSGITVNGVGEEALLDTRVNIDTQANPYFIEMLRERENDCHFNVTPMDVYVYDGGSVTVEILDADQTPWIRMEPMVQSPTANGRKKAEEAGDGKRNYFTTDLLDELNEQENSTSYTVTEPEERIYFYIDENVPQQGHRDGDDVPARDATLRITYKNADGTQTATREIPIHQAGMKAVYFDKFYRYDNDGTPPYYIYIEDKEEYLAHYDGKNKYTDTQEGFIWGLDGMESGLGVQNGHNYSQFMRWGWKNTMQIMDRYRSSTQWRGHEMTLNDTPSGAAEYCYNKNKRNAQGKVVEARWFLPTISELEYMLEEFYGDYDVFQDKWYWSSNPGAAGQNGDNGENNQYARATRIKYEPGNEEADPATGYVHYRSNPDWPYSPDDNAPNLGGHALRSESFRIRAAYIYQVPESNGYVTVPGVEEN